MPPSKNRKSSLLTEERKEIVYTTRILQRVTFPV
jgi:hypothetical protein